MFKLRPTAMPALISIKKSPCLLGFLLLLFVVSTLAVIKLTAVWFQPPAKPEQDLCQIFRANERILGHITRDKAWWEYACMIERYLDKSERYNCKSFRQMGFYNVCWDPLVIPKPPCLVYSFGINNEFEFDDTIAGEGCQVYAFDPSMGVGDHQHAPRVAFKALGLATLDSDTYQPNLDSYVTGIVQWKVRTLDSILKMLGHQNRTIDILKIDIESYEWRVMRQLLTSGHLQRVRQLLIEWHIFPNEPFRHHFAQMHQTLKDLRGIGFMLFNTFSFQRHHKIDYFNSQADTGWINTNFLANLIN